MPDGRGGSKFIYEFHKRSSLVIVVRLVSDVCRLEHSPDVSVTLWHQLGATIHLDFLKAAIQCVTKPTFILKLGSDSFGRGSANTKNGRGPQLGLNNDLLAYALQP